MRIRLVRTAVLFICLSISSEVTLSQDTHHERITTLLAEVSEQRLQDHVRAMEEAGGTRNRVTFTPGKDSAAVYIRLAFQAMPGIDEVLLDTFYIASAVPPFNLKPQVNVIAVLRGTLPSDEYFVVGSHYDATADRDAGWNNGHTWQTIQAPGANDNGSGVAALGTRYVQANQNFFTGLIMNGFPFANGTYSDHQSYADEGYPAILIIENAAPWNTNSFYTANPYYHMTTDTWDRINYELVRRVTQLNIAALATEAGVATGLTKSIFSDLPTAARLNPNYPNPFNPSTNIPFSLPEASPIRLTVYNAVGQQVAVLADGVWPTGEHIITFNAAGLSSGLYVYRLETTGEITQSRTMLLVK